ncbi:hypothetical protein ACRAWG_37920 [Methylobacterium sp. P31]
MARRVRYRICDRPEGRFDAVVTIEPDTVVRRDGFNALAEVEEWIEGPRILMAALGAPVAQGNMPEPSTEPAATVETEPDGSPRPGRLRTAR